jgi:hypothetical protein
MNAPDGELAHTVASLRQSVFRHPVAAQAIYAALLAEGRRFATTAEGRVWRERLSGSALAGAGRSLLDSIVLDAFEESADGAIPSRLLEALAVAARTRGLEALLARALPEG